MLCYSQTISTSPVRCTPWRSDVCSIHKDQCIDTGSIKKRGSMALLKEWNNPLELYPKLKKTYEMKDTDWNNFAKNSLCCKGVQVKKWENQWLAWMKIEIIKS